MYDWKGRYIEEDDPDPVFLHRDRKGHFLPLQPVGIQIYRWGEDPQYGPYPIYDRIPLKVPIPEGWMWEQPYYACKRCGHVLAEDAREV